MKLKTLNILGYKNIENITIDFSKNNNTSVLVGNNGCGKSNILEAISSIFAGLYMMRKLKPKFKYQISYTIDGKNVDISLKKSMYVIKVDANAVTKEAFVKEGGLLPSNIICCYSGESLRLWENYYKPFYNDYIDKIKSQLLIPKLPLIYINKYSLNISLLTLFYHDFSSYTDIAGFCQEILGVKSIDRITFNFDTKKIKKWPNNHILNLIKAICGVEDVKNMQSTYVITLDDFKNKIEPIVSNGKELFSCLYGATMPKDDKIITLIEMECVLQNGSKIKVDDLSEGEKKNLLITTILEVLTDENSLILFDEPDSHIHINCKRVLKDTLDKYQGARESVITTHSPTLASAFENENQIVGLGLDDNNKTKIIDKSTADLIFDITNGMWNVQQQNIFLASNKPVTLLVEGKTDKIHIEEAFKHLKTDYPELDFDIFSMNSSEHIKEILIGMSCSEIKWKKKFIGICDNDKAGKDCVKALCGKEGNPTSIMPIKCQVNNSQSCFYAFLLPKKNNYNANEAYTIENCYPASKYQDAFEQALNEKKGYFDNLSIDKIATDIKEKSKTILASNAKKFVKNDFDGFRPIFNLINKINKL